MNASLRKGGLGVLKKCYSGQAYIDAARPVGVSPAN